MKIQYKIKPITTFGMFSLIFKNGISTFIFFKYKAYKACQTYSSWMLFIEWNGELCENDVLASFISQNNDALYRILNLDLSFYWCVSTYKCSLVGHVFIYILRWKVDCLTPQNKKTSTTNYKKELFVLDAVFILFLANRVQRYLVTNVGFHCSRHLSCTFGMIPYGAIASMACIIDR